MAEPRRIDWVVKPPEICCLCHEPLGAPAETSAWNGRPAHRDCVRIHIMQGDPAFRETEGPIESPEEDSSEAGGGVLPRDDEDDGF